MKLALLHELGDPDARYAVGDGAVPTPMDRARTPAWCARTVATVLFDFNHPLAGQPVHFEVLLIGVL